MTIETAQSIKDNLIMLDATPVDMIGQKTIGEVVALQRGKEIAEDIEADRQIEQILMGEE